MVALSLRVLSCSTSRRWPADRDRPLQLLCHGVDCVWVLLLQHARSCILHRPGPCVRVVEEQQQRQSGVGLFSLRAGMLSTHSPCACPTTV